MKTLTAIIISILMLAINLLSAPSAYPAIYRNTAGQRVVVYAFDTAEDGAKTGDASSIWAYVSKDGGTPAALGDAHPTELHATNAPGIYVFDLTQTETDAELLVITPQSETEGVAIEPVVIYTLPQIATFQSGLASTGEAASALANYDPPTKSELDSAVSPLATAAALATVDGVVDGIASTVVALNDISAADVWAYSTRLLTAGTNIVLAKGTGLTGLNDLSASDTRTALGLASANLDTQLADLPTYAQLLAALADADDAVLAAIGDLHDYDGSDTAGVTTLLTRLSSARAGYLDKLNVTGVLAHSDAADAYKADVSGLATLVQVSALRDDVATTSGIESVLTAIDENGAGGSADWSTVIDDSWSSNTVGGALLRTRAAVYDSALIEGTTITLSTGAKQAVTAGGRLTVE